MSLSSLIVIGLVIVMAFLAGVHGTSNVVATMIASHAFRPVTALVTAAAAEFIGPFLFGVAVARTIGAEFVRADAISLQTLMAGIGSAILWNIIVLALGLPSSLSHAMTGGLIGATLFSAGRQAILVPGLIKILVALFTAPLIGFGVGFILMRVILFLVRDASPNINRFFKLSQYVTALSLIMSQSANNAQSAMGLISLSLVISGSLSQFSVPTWVVFASASALTLGTAFGGWHLIRILGSRYYKIRPVHGFSSQLASTIVLLVASLVGWPVSTTQAVSSTIVGVGSSERLSKVRWDFVGDIMWSWVLTIPCVAALAAGLAWLLNMTVH